jgi:adenylate cyclase class 2
MPISTEREVKLRFGSPEDARAAVRDAGATLVKDRRLQRDALFDTRAGALRRSRRTLRLRTEPDGCTLTFKGPPEASSMKVREEAETSVADERVLVQVFAALDLEITFRYEKYREEYSAPGVLIAIDETPVGTYVEIEGSEDGIVSAAAALGRRPSDFMVESYRGLFMRHREQLGLQGPHMLFELE